MATLALAGVLTASCASSPRGEGVSYTVRRGDTIYSIARRHGVSPRAVVEANHIRNVRAVRVGTRLWIPANGRSAPRRNGGSAALAGPPRAREPARSPGSLKLAWPVSGTVTSGYGRRNGRAHEGIDIAARRGTAIRAAQSGKVIFSGRLGDYGRTVVIKHEGHYRTVYAHARQLHVKKGQFVERGQKIASVGTSGNATGPHLHFELRSRDRAVDPLRHLP